VDSRNACAERGLPKKKENKIKVRKLEIHARDRFPCLRLQVNIARNSALKWSFFRQRNNAGGLTSPKEKGGITAVAIVRNGLDASGRGLAPNFPRDRTRRLRCGSGWQKHSLWVGEAREARLKGGGGSASGRKEWFRKWQKSGWQFWIQRARGPIQMSKKQQTVRFFQDARNCPCSNLLSGLSEGKRQQSEMKNTTRLEECSD